MKWEAPSGTLDCNTESQDQEWGKFIYEVSSFSHGKYYRNDLSDGDKCW